MSGHFRSRLAARAPAPPMDAPPRGDQGLIGARLRTLRQGQSLTLKDVATATGLSVGHLSQLERDLVSPSIKTLHDISRALGVNISWFFQDEPTGNPLDQYVVRAGSRQRISFAGGVDDYRLNSSAIRDLGLLYSTFEPGASSGEADYTHEGEEAGLVVAGALELWIDGEATRLEAGDSFSFPSTRPHRYRNPGADAAVVIWAMTPRSY